MNAIKEPLRVLVIEPEPEVIPILIEMLEMDGHEVEWFASMASVLSEASSHFYDVVLVAWANAGTQESQQALSLMLAHFSKTPLVLAVDATDVREAAEALNHGVFGYLLRPYLLGELRTMLNRVQQAKVSAYGEREHERFYKILEQVQQLHGHLEPEEALSWLMASAIEGVGAAAGAILLLEPERGELRFEVVSGEGREGVRGLRVPVGKGICGWVAAHNRAQIILNAQDDPRFHPQIDAFTGLKTTTVLAVPLHRAGQVVGVIEVINASKGYFSEGNKRLLSLIASEASLALEKATLLLSSQAQVRELTRLYEVSIRLSTTYHTPEILQLIVDNLTTTLGPDCSASINVYNRQEQKILVRAAAGVRPLENLLLPPRRDGLGARARHEKKPVLVDYAFANPMIDSTGLHDHVQAAFAVPLLEGERALGALYVDTIAPRQFGQADVRTTEFFANQAVIALRNARYVQQLLALTDIAEELASERELRPLLNSICQQAVELLDSDSSNILLIVEEHNKPLLRIWGHYGVGERCVEETGEQLGEGIAGRVAATGKPLIDNNIPQNGLLSNPAATEENFQSIASVPIFRDKQVIGTLDIHSKTHLNAFSDDDLHILTLMARQVAIAIYNNDILERFRRVIESAPEGIIGINAAGKVIEFNEEAERLVGYSANEAKQMHVIELYAGGVAEARQINRALYKQPDGRLHSHEATIKHASGEVIPIRLAVARYKSLTGQAQGAFGYFRDLREFEAVDEFAQSLLGSPEEQGLWQRIVATLAHTLHAEFSILLRYDNRSNSLKGQASYGLPNEMDLEYQLDEGVVGQVFSSNQAQRTTQSEYDERMQLHFACARLGKYSQFGAIHNCLAVPLAYQDEPLGVLLLLNKQKKNTLIETGFTPGDDSLLTTLAGQIVGLLQRAKHRAGLEALIDVGTQIVATLDEAKVLQKIVEALVATFGFRVVYFRLVALDGSLVICANAGTDGDYDHNSEYRLKPGQGITSEVLQHGKAIWIEDAQAEARYALPKMAKRHGLRGLLAVPLIFEGQPIGTLTCYTGRPHRFTADEVHLVSAFANLATVALTNARQISKLYNLEQAGKALASLMHEGDVRQAIAENVLDVIEAEGAFVCLYDSVAERFDLERAVGVGLGEDVIVWSPKLRSKKTPKVNGIIDTIMGKTVLFVKDVLAPAAEERIGKLTQRRLDAVGIRAFIGVRLQVGEELVGALFLNYSHPYTPLSSDNEKATLKIYADQAALAVIRARLFEWQKQKQELIHSVANATSSMQDVQATWHELLEGAMKLTKAELSCIGILDEAKGIVTYEAQKGYTLGSLKPEYKIGSHSIVGWVVEHKKSVFVKNVLTQNPWCDIYSMSEPDTRSHLTVPIKRGKSQQVVGAITVESPREGAFNTHDQRLLERLAIHADIAIQNARLYDAQRHQVEQLHFLLKAGQGLIAFQPINEKLQALINNLCRSLCYDNVILYPYNQNRQEFDWPLVSGELNFEITTQPLKKGSQAWRLLREGPDSYFTSGSPHDALLSGPFVAREGIRASGYIKLIANQQVVGLLFVNKRKDHIFLEEEQNNLQNFAEEAAQLIFSGSILQPIVDSLHQAMGFDLVTLYLYDAKRDKVGPPVVGGELQAKHDWEKVQVEGAVRAALEGEATYFSSHTQDDPILFGLFAQREGVISSGYVRLEVGNQPVAVLFVNWRHVHHWSENEQQAVQLFANQAAIAIRNMQQYHTLERNRQQQVALHNAGKTIAKAGLEIEAVLQAILAQAIGVTGAPFGTLQLVTGNDLQFVATWPIERCEILKEELGVMPINGPGITARAIRQNDAQLVPDVTADPDFVDATSETGSELAVVLRQDEKPIGVLNVEHREVGGFDEEDRQLLISLSNLAVVALKNAEQYEELERLRDHLLTSEAVAWLGLLGAEWKHAINQKTFSIANYVNGLRRSLKNYPPTPLVGEVLKTLERIEKITKNIRGMQFINQMSSKLSQVSGETMIDDELYRFVESRCRSQAGVKTVFEFNCPAIAVRIEPQWLRVAMEKLVGNALEAMPTGGTLTIATKLVDEQVYITIKDTGGGIAESVLPDFLKRVIPQRKGEPGTGMGAIISRFIAINHHGELILVKTLPNEGTELCLRLPIT